MKKYLILIAPLILLAGCKEEAKSMRWYMDHETELNTVYAECKASGDDSLNCKNARAAHFRIQQDNAPIPSLGGTLPDNKK